MNCKNRTLLTTLLFAIVTAFFHILAIRFFLYFTIPWYDIPMHFIGGITIGFFAIWLQKLFIPKTCSFFLITIVYVISATFLGGILWELFELNTGLIFKITPLGLTYTWDTTKDMAMDLIGGLCAFLFTITRINKSN